MIIKNPDYAVVQGIGELMENKEWMEKSRLVSELV